MTCLNQLRKVSHAFSFFALDHNNKLPYANWSNNSSRVFRGWDDFIQPYLGKEPQIQVEFDGLKIPQEKGMMDLICPASVTGPIQEITNGLNVNYIMPMGSWSVSQGRYISNATTGLQSTEPEHRPLVEIEDPSYTLLLSEIDVKAPHHIQGIGRLLRSPHKQIEEKSNGLTLQAEANTTLLLHPNGELAYLYVDGHVESDVFNSPYHIGEGTIENPKGAWTVESQD